MPTKRKATPKKRKLRLKLTGEQKRKVKQKTGASVSSLSLTDADLKRAGRSPPYD
jgi:hypothetical protein